MTLGCDDLFEAKLIILRYESYIATFWIFFDANLFYFWISKSFCFVLFQAEYDKEVETARAEAELAYRLQVYYSENQKTMAYKEEF